MENINIVEELKNYLKNTPKEQQQKDWEEIKMYGEFGPTVDEFLNKSPYLPTMEEIEKASFEEFTKVMDREDEIANASQKCIYELCNDYVSTLDIKKGFEIGVEWADKNPSKNLVDLIIHQYIVSCDEPDLSCLNDRLNWIMETYWKN